VNKIGEDTEEANKKKRMGRQIFQVQWSKHAVT